MAKKVRFEFTLDDLVPDIKLTRAAKDDAIDSVKDFVLEQVLSHVGDGKSPVSGHGKFPALSKDYVKVKKEEGGTVLFGRGSNLELHGDLMDSVRVDRKGNRLILTVDEDQQPKADGHNNFSGKSQLPMRRFVPNEDDGETFKASILKGIRKIVKAAAADGE